MRTQEPRKSPRLAVNISALAESVNRDFANCNITNISTDGIFIQCGQADTGKQTLPISLIDSLGDVILVRTNKFSTMVRIVRIADNGLGAIYLH